jgi:hypothetical protein
MNEVTKVELTFTGMIPGDDDIAEALRNIAKEIEKGRTEGADGVAKNDAWQLVWRTWIED